MTFKGVVSKLVAAAKDFKAAVLKAADEAPAIAADVEHDAPEVEALTQLVFPGAVAVEQLAVEAFETICDATESAGTAAGANGLSVSFDQAFVTKVKAVMPALKAAAAKA